MNSQTCTARDLTRCHYGKNLVYFPSRKNNQQMICESQLEADFCLLLEHSRETVSYQCQPETLALTQINHRSSYTPDFLVETCETKFYVEIKPDKTKLHTPYLERILAARSMLQDRGSDLYLADDKEIRSGNKLKSLQRLYSRSFNVAHAEYEHLLDQIRRTTGEFTLEEFLNSLPYISHSAKYLAIFDGYLAIDLETPLTLCTTLKAA